MLHYPGLFDGFLLFGQAGCSRTAVPKSEISRSPSTDDPSNLLLDRGEEQNLVSPTGTPIPGLLGTPDLLLPRNPDHELFMEPGNSIRPFEAVYFDFDPFTAPNQRGKVIELAEFLAENRDARLLIEGYCGPEGNGCLQQITRRTPGPFGQGLPGGTGADSRRIDTVSIGDEHAIPEAMADQASLDRRAEFVISKGD